MVSSFDFLPWLCTNIGTDETVGDWEDFKFPVTGTISHGLGLETPEGSGRQTPVKSEMPKAD